MKRTILLLLSFLAFLSCEERPQKGSFAYDVDFLSTKKETIVLQENGGQSQVLIVPDYQGRVMTSTANGDKGNSYGWLNYDLINSGEIQPQINAVGGEDRFWLGPEGGQYSIFFKAGEEFSFENWQTPLAIDTEPFQTVGYSQKEAIFEKAFKITNYQDFTFNVKVNRKVEILDKAEVKTALGAFIPEGLAYVGFSTTNTITNSGDKSWTKKTGLLSIWVLGMFKPSPQTTVIIPFKNDLALNTAYFGEIGDDRLQTKDNLVLFKGDGKYRSKIGLPASNATGVLGSYDAAQNVLTVVQYSFAGDTTYVNSLWEIQAEPYAGDVANAYNDGPLENGNQLGPFYELESSSPAKELAPEEQITHIHKTFHFEGSKEDLDAICKQVFGTGLDNLLMN